MPSGFGWALPELATARRTIGTELTNPDFVALARGFGVEGKRITEPAELEGTIRDAGAATEPLLIEVPVGEMPSPWHLIAEHNYDGTR